MLLCVLICGLATSLKRVYVAIIFGRRQLLVFKPRLTRLLADIDLLSDVTALASSIDEMKMETAVLRGERCKGLANVTWKNPKQVAPPPQQTEDDTDSLDGSDDVVGKDEAAYEMEGSIRSDMLSVNNHKGLMSMTSSGTHQISELLEQWTDPVNKQDKNMEVTIADVLKFKRALGYMDDDYPFGIDDGPCSTRQESITSAQAVYMKLLKLGPDDSSLPFKTLEMLMVNEDGQTDIAKRRALKRLFRPGKSYGISLLAFVQSCDTMYKRVRFFRASVGNASVIDKVSGELLST